MSIKFRCNNCFNYKCAINNDCKRNCNKCKMQYTAVMCINAKIETELKIKTIDLYCVNYEEYRKENKKEIPP